MKILLLFSAVTSLWTSSKRCFVSAIEALDTIYSLIRT
jgi:hypothetical protein